MHKREINDDLIRLLAGRVLIRRDARNYCGFHESASLMRIEIVIKIKFYIFTTIIFNNITKLFFRLKIEFLGRIKL